MFEAEGEWKQSAEVLCGIPLESGQKYADQNDHLTTRTCVCVFRVYESGFKMNVYIKIAQLYLEDEDHVAAEAYVNRAGLLQAEVNNKELHIKYKVSRRKLLHNRMKKTSRKG